MKAASIGGLLFWESIAVTQTIQHIRLDEISVLRIVCQEKDCGATIEVPLNKAAEGIRKVTCPGCGTQLTQGMNEREDPYRDLAKVIEELAGFTDHFRVELPIKAEEK